MPLVTGSLTYLTFDVSPSKTIDIRTHLTALNHYRFKGITPQDRQMQSIGWAKVESRMAEDELLVHDVEFGPYLVLVLREDKVTIPANIVTHEVNLRLDQHREAGEYISRKLKKSVTELVVAELKTQVLPKQRFIELVWDQTTGLVRVFGRGPLATEALPTLFERTFKSKLHHKSFGQRVEDYGFSKKALAILKESGPTTLFHHATPKRDVVKNEGGST